MSDGKVRGWLVAIGSIYAAMIIVASWPAGPRLPCQLIQDHSQRSQAKKSEHAANENPYWCYKTALSQLRNSTLGESVNSYPDSEPKKYDETDGPNYDLYAQKSMAISTARMVVIAWFSLLISLLALFLVYRTLAATREAVGVAREIGKKEVRAYLSVKKVKVIKIEISSSVTVSVNVVNTGQTPATDVSVVMGLPFGFSDKPINLLLNYDENKVREFKFPIAPGGSSKALVAHPGQLVPAWFEKYKDGTGKQYCIVVISYTDVFGNKHETGYRGLLNAESLRDGKPFFQLCEEGNYST